MSHGVPGQVHLSALPRDAGEARLAGNLEPRVVVADDVPQAVHVPAGEVERDAAGPGDPELDLADAGGEGLWLVPVAMAPAILGAFMVGGPDGGIPLGLHGDAREPAEDEQRPHAGELAAGEMVSQRQRQPRHDQEPPPATRRLRAVPSRAHAPDLRQLPRLG